MSLPNDPSIYQNITCNYAIIGTKNSGKTTFIKSILGASYDNPLNKNCVKIYKTDCSLDMTLDHIELIKKLDVSSDTYKSSEIKEVSLVIPKTENIFNTDKIDSIIYDIPGLNGLMKESLIQYIVDNFYKFDVVYYIVDIDSGFQTIDEIEILKLIRVCMISIDKMYNKTVKLIIICNKCDNMYLDKTELICSSTLHESNYNNICKVLVDLQLKCVVIKYSALYTYIYRLAFEHFENKHKKLFGINVKLLDDEFINKIGIDNFGKISWNKIQRIKTVDILKEMIKPFIFTDVNFNLNVSGYNILKNITNKFIFEPKIFMNMLYEKIYLNDKVDDIESKLNFLKKFDKIFSTDYTTKRFQPFLKTYLKHIHNKTTMIEKSTHVSPKKTSIEFTSVGTQTDEELEEYVISETTVDI
jgi:GTPase SAR1 family protein